MKAFSLAESADFGILRLIVSDVDLAVRVLKEAHLGVSVNDVLCLSCPNTPGSLAAILEYLAKEDVFIEYMYAFSNGERANVVIRPTDIKKCVEILTVNNCELLNQDTATHNYNGGIVRKKNHFHQVTNVVSGFSPYH